MKRVRVLVGMCVVSLLLAACGTDDGGAAQGEGGVPADPTMSLDHINWIVAADVVEERDGVHGRMLDLQLVNTEVLSTAVSDPRHGVVDFGEVRSGRASLNVRDSDRSYTGGRFIFALQPAGTRADQLAGVQENGAPVLSVAMIFDEGWTLLEAKTNQTALYRELLALYGPPSLATVRALIDDARVVADWWASHAPDVLDEPDAPELDLRSLPPRPSTPGPLGEWRRVNGWEDDPAAPSQEQQQLEAWLAADPAIRRLPDVDDGQLPLDELAAALGTDVLVDWRVYLLHADAFQREYPWVGLRLVDVGVQGLLSTSGHEVFYFSTLGPVDATAELVAWRDPDSDAVDVADPDLVVALPGWRPPEVVLIDLHDSIEHPAVRTTDEDEGWRVFHDLFEATG